MKRAWIIRAFLVVSLSWCGAAVGHVPTVSDGSAVDADHAIRLPDVDVSRVVYHRVTEAAPRVWLEFNIAKPTELYMQLGVPLINRLSDYRPAMVILGPGLPSVDLPFEIPDGVGGIVFNTDDVERPEGFDEPFSRTASWILKETTVDLSQSGRYYIVAFDPAGLEGKLWISTGLEEAFELEDILELPTLLAEVRRFHEVPMGLGIPCVLLPIGAIIVVGLVARMNRTASLLRHTTRFDSLSESGQAMRPLTSPPGG